jgi:hypothetical protein
VIYSGISNDQQQHEKRKINMTALGQKIRIQTEVSSKTNTFPLPLYHGFNNSLA